MEKFEIIDALAVPLDRPNVDTDAIIPKQFLKSIKRSGFGPNLFDEWRYLGSGEPGMDNTQRTLNPDFVLNNARYQGGGILLARENFGCGSSREHAVWALLDYGHVVIHVFYEPVRHFYDLEGLWSDARRIQTSGLKNTRTEPADRRFDRDGFVDEVIE